MVDDGFTSLFGNSEVIRGLLESTLHTGRFLGLVGSLLLLKLVDLILDLILHLLDSLFSDELLLLSLVSIILQLLLLLNEFGALIGNLLLQAGDGLVLFLDHLLVVLHIFLDLLVKVGIGSFGSIGSLNDIFFDNSDVLDLNLLFDDIVIHKLEGHLKLIGLGLKFLLGVESLLTGLLSISFRFLPPLDELSKLLLVLISQYLDLVHVTCKSRFQLDN